jgi:hypothetical protein
MHNRHDIPKYCFSAMLSLQTDGWGEIVFWYLQYQSITYICRCDWNCLRYFHCNRMEYLPFVANFFLFQYMLFTVPVVLHSCFILNIKENVIIYISFCLLLTLAVYTKFSL